MGAYRVADLFRVPSLISLARLPLAVAFAVVDEPAAGMALLVAAGVSDMLDGWYARRYDMATPTGAVVDPITDKLFALTVIITLVIRGLLPVWAVALLATREIGELPLVAWFAVSAKARHDKAEEARANIPGKAATVFQFFTVGCALFRHPAMTPMAILTAAVGAFAAWSYWRRALAK